MGFDHIRSAARPDGFGFAAHGAIKSGLATAIGILGIGLIAISDRWKSTKQS